MNVSLTSQLENWINEKVASGRYSSASEVIREALRIMEERERSREMQIQEVREKITEGLRELDAGKGIPGDQAFAALKKKIQESRKKKSKK